MTISISMNYSKIPTKLSFNWQSQSSSNDVRMLIETKIVQDISSGHLPFQACHAGNLVVTLANEDPHHDTLVGNIRCNCGMPLGVIRGKSDGSSLSYQAVNSSKKT